MPRETQDSKLDTISAAVTTQEKWRVELVKKKTGRTTSELLRDYSLSELIEWGRRLDEALDAIAEQVA